MQIGRCRIYHRGQPRIEKSCFNCFQEGHWKNECKNQRACRVCKKRGHKEGDEACEHYLINDAIVFKGDEDQLSNFFKCDIEWGDLILPSAEHVYQVEKAKAHQRPEIVVEIQRATDARSAKAISYKIITRKGWEEENQVLMMDILRAKFDQHPELRKTLMESGDTVIAECVPNQFMWSTGLSKEAAARTHPEKWPGKNILGEMMVELRQEYRDKQKEAQIDQMKKEESIGSKQINKAPLVYKTDTTKRKHSGQQTNTPQAKQRLNGTTPDKDAKKSNQRPSKIK